MDLFDLLPDIEERTAEGQHFEFVVNRFFGPASGRQVQLLDSRGDRTQQRALAVQAAAGHLGGAGQARRYQSSRRGVAVHDYATGIDYTWTWLQIIDRALAGIHAGLEQEIRAEHAAKRARTAAARADFERRVRWWPDGSEVIWTDPEDPSRTGPGWRCWYCDGVEFSEFLLQNNHWATSPWAIEHGRCIAQRYRDIAAGHDADQSVQAGQ